MFEYIAKNINNTNMVIDGSGRTLKESMGRRGNSVNLNQPNDKGGCSC